MSKMKDLSILIDEAEYALVVIERHLESGDILHAFEWGINALDLLRDITALHKQS